VQARRSSSPSRPRPKQEAIWKQAREIALAFLTYGYRKVWAELTRRGMVATESMVYRVLKEGLLLLMKRRPKAKSQGPEPPKPKGVGLVLSADSTLWRLIEHGGSPALGDYRIFNVIEEESRYLLASVVDQVGEGETARLAKEAIERAREEARGLGLSTKRPAASHRSGRCFSIRGVPELP